MKLRLLLIVVILVFPSFFCSSDKNQSEKIIDFSSFNITKKSFAILKDAGKIRKVIKLETKRESLLGRIQRIEVDKDTNDLVVGDFRITKQVLRFTKDGTYIRKYGQKGEGPGGYRGLFNFTVTRSGDVILLAGSKLMKFSRQGKLLLESRFNYFAKHIESINDLIFIQVIRYRSNPGNKKAVLILNSNFEQIGTIGKYDVRLEKMIFGLWGSLARNKDLLYYTDHYNLTLNIYNTKTQQLAHLEFPNQNSKINGLWNKKKLSMDDEQEISTNLHRFLNIKSFGDHIFLFEICNKTETNNIWLLNLNTKEALVFNRSCLTGNKSIKDIYFYTIPGSFNKGIIGVFNDAEQFNLHKEKYPLLKDIQFKADDNPILAFFEFHK